ncbi:MAG: acyl-CoA thioesterase [Burkholderiales bacterium]
MTTSALPDRQPTLRVVAMPGDVNVLGSVFGGWIMAQVDIAASIPAIRHAQGRVATRAVNSFEFREPLFVGDVVSFYADVVKVGKTSITVDVDVYAERLRERAYQSIKVTQAQLTFVALDERGQPRSILG